MQHGNNNTEPITSSFRITIIFLMILTGAINTLAYKFQNKQYVYEGPYYKYFFHPYMQATTMFFGELLALFVFLYIKYRDPEAYKMRMLAARSKGKQIQMNKFLLAVPAFCDFVSSTLHYIALNYVSGSVYLMMRGGTIITTFLFSKLILRVKVNNYQILGSCMAVVGVVVVGISNIAFQEHGSSSQDTSKQIIGYVLLIISLFFNGFFFVYEQKLLSKYHLQPLEVVGYEGIFGLCMYGVVIAIISFVPCNLGASACVIGEDGLSFFQLPSQYFRQAFSNIPLLIFCILGVFSIATFNITGVSVTKYINALARSICDVTRTVIVWTVGIIVTVTAGSAYPNYVWEQTYVWAVVLELVGFCILIGANMIYNKLVKMPCFEKKEKDQGARSLISQQNQENITH